MRPRSRPLFPVVSPAQPLALVDGHLVQAVRQGGLGSSFGFPEHVSHGPGPLCLTPIGGHILEVAEDMGIADPMSGLVIAPVRRPAIMYQHAAHEGKDAELVGGLPAPLAMDAQEGEGEVEATWNHHLVPATREPVSSTLTTSEPASASAWSVAKSVRPAAASLAKPARKPVETGAPSRSDIASAVRSTGMSWRFMRYRP